jgi:glycosyltransferase involved in cell wall biosynthesis
MIAPTPFFSHRGSHIRILEEARALEQLGHEIMIVTYHNGDDIAKYIATTIDVRRIRRWLFWYKKTEAGPDWQKVLLNIFLIKKTFTMMHRWQPDIVHAHLHEGVIIARLMQMIFFWKKVRVVSDFHGSLVGEMRSHGYLSVPPFGTIFRFIERKVNAMGDRAIVSSEENMEIIRMAREDKTAAHVYDGVSLDVYDRLMSSKSAYRSKYQVPENAFVVVYTGALIENKGIENVLRVIPNIIIRMPDVHFVIGGYPDTWVRRFVEEQDLSKHVTIISPLNYFDLAEVNYMADVAIDPKEATVRQASGKLLQYMAAHTGIICADRPTNKNYLRTESAIFLPEVTPENIATAVERFYVDRAYLEHCAQNAYEDVQSFDWRVIGAKIAEVYEDMGNDK